MKFEMFIFRHIEKKKLRISEECWLYSTYISTTICLGIQFNELQLSKSLNHQNLMVFGIPKEIQYDNFHFKNSKI